MFLKWNSNLSFSEELPPQLTLHLASGHAAIGPSGEVLVYPGSIFHIDCLFDRRKGNPEWNTKKPGKRYPKGMYFVFKYPIPWDHFQANLGQSLKLKLHLCHWNWWQPLKIMNYLGNCNVLLDSSLNVFLCTGWVVGNEDRDWQFRISIYYAGDEDTNSFKCKTPRGKENTINVVITGKILVFFQAL